MLSASFVRQFLDWFPDFFFILDGIFKPFDVYQDSGVETTLYVYICLLFLYKNLENLLFHVF